MKNKNIYSIILALIVMISACDSTYDDIYDKIDEKGDPVVSSIEYTLTSDDYATIADLALKANPNDTVNAEFISTYKYFTNETGFQDYVSMYLNDLYPWLDAGSTASITYNFNDSTPDEYEMYVEAENYYFTSADYDAVNGQVGSTEFFYSEFNPDFFIADVLVSSITGASNGDVYLINYKYSDETPILVPSEYTVLLDEDFESVVAYDPAVDNLTGWTEYLEAGSSEVWEGREYSGNKYVQFSAFNSGEASNISWLITPEVDLTDYSIAILNFSSKDGYNNGDPVTVLISTNYSGSGDPNAATWVDLNPTLSTGNTGGYASSFTESGNVNLNAYCGNTAYIAFKYEGGDGGVTTTLQIDDVTVRVQSAGYQVTGGDDYTRKEYYTYNGSTWSKDEDIYALSAKDYDEMGDPGNYDSFSSSVDPQDYLPYFLYAMYPTAGEGVSKMISYRYYTGTDAGTVTVVDEYTKTSGVWTSNYAYVQEKTAQWAVSATSNVWVFDPTETYTMVSADYQTIVDYVQATYGDSYIDSYGTAEFYYGAGSYYSNFDLRSGKWNSDEFSKWQEAVEAALRDVLLPAIRPNATIMVNGVDMFYIINFDTYDGSVGAEYSMKFKVSNESPLTFELVDGPMPI